MDPEAGSLLDGLPHDGPQGMGGESLTIPRTPFPQLGPHGCVSQHGLLKFEII